MLSDSKNIQIREKISRQNRGDDRHDPKGEDQKKTSPIRSRGRTVQIDEMPTPIDGNCCQTVGHQCSQVQRHVDLKLTIDSPGERIQGEIAGQMNNHIDEFVEKTEKIDEQVIRRPNQTSHALPTPLTSTARSSA